MKKLLTSLFVLGSCSGGSSFSWVNEVSWSSEVAFIDCLAGACKVMMDDETKETTSNKNKAAVGESISVYQTIKSTGDRKLLKTYRIRGIAIDGNTCWLNVKPGESDSFLVVEGCSSKS